MSTPGQQSRGGQIFELVTPDGLRRLLDYVFDCTDGPGAVYVLAGWSDRYGGRGCASGTMPGEPNPLERGGWQIGLLRLEPYTGGQHRPSATRERARECTQADSGGSPASSPPPDRRTRIECAGGPELTQQEG